MSEIENINKCVQELRQVIHEWMEINAKKINSISPEILILNLGMHLYLIGLHTMAEEGRSISDPILFFLKALSQEFPNNFETKMQLDD